jgi:Tropinone reductase 1
LPPETTAVVTGGTKGIGRAIVEELVSHGCRVLTCSRNQEELQELLDKYPSCHGVVANVATPEGRATLVEAIREHFGHGLDILVNNVGTNVRKASSVDYTDDDVQHVWNTNFNGMFALTTACHPFLKRSDGTTSSVVNIGSVAGVTCLKSGTPYAATKAAMNQVTGNWACEWGPDGIRVNCVAPWYINTQLAKQVLKNEAYKR